MTKPMRTEVTILGAICGASIATDRWTRTLRRWRNNYFAFWVVCETRACRRAKRCAGDPKSCHDRIWPHMPERIKFDFRVTLKAINEGLPP